MSIAVQFDIRDHATRAINAAIYNAEPNRVAEVARPHLERFWRQRLVSLGPNKRGWPTTRFYERAADAVTASTNGGAVVLQADHQGLRQRWLGGEIRPREAKALTIPISPQSYGKTAAEFEGLFLLKTKKGAYLVRYTNTTTASGKSKFARTEDRKLARRRVSRGVLQRQQSTLEFLFKLVASVTQTGDARVVPTNDEFAEVAMAAIAKRFEKPAGGAA